MSDVKTPTRVPPRPVVGAVKPVEEKKLPSPEFKGQPGPSIIPPEFRHLVFITGIRGHGKTHFLCSIENPSNVLFLDYESKGESVASNLGIENYFSVCDEVAGLWGYNAAPLRVYQRTRQIVEAIPQDRFTALLLDNAVLLQQGCHEEVQRSPHTYSIDPQKAESGAYGGAWPGVRTILRGLFSVARSRGIKVIGVSFQLTGAWKDGKPLFNKFKTTDVSLWHELSVLTLVLVPGFVSPPKPAALVMKEQLAKAKWNGVRVEVQRRLPFKLAIAEMWEVYNYLDNPADFKNPKPGETPEPGEADPYLPTFSREQLQIQLKMMELAAKMSETGEGE